MSLINKPHHLEWKVVWWQTRWACRWLSSVDLMFIEAETNARAFDRKHSSATQCSWETAGTRGSVILQVVNWCLLRTSSRWLLLCTIKTSILPEEAKSTDSWLLCGLHFSFASLMTSSESLFSCRLYPAYLLFFAEEDGREKKLRLLSCFIFLISQQIHLSSIRIMKLRMNDDPE